MKTDWLIVGAGYTGAIIAERIATQLDQKVLVVEKRSHIAGNAYDYYDDHGVLIHKYGPHIFHTNSKKVWDYLSGFTTWRPYYHKVLGVVEGKRIPIPFNFNSLYAVFPQDYASKLEQLLIDKFGYGQKVPILKLRKEKSKDLSFLADYIYKHVFLGYTLKQWGLKPEDLDKSVTGRIPIYLSRDNRYFQDEFQAIPEHGYTRMFENILNHKNIKVLLNTDYKEVVGEVSFNKMVYSGPLDAYFDFKHGELPYRSLSFGLKNIPKDHFQEVAQVNYPNEYDYTRITEFKYLSGQEVPSTTVAYEFPQAYVRGENTPYYPIPKDENTELANKYKAEAKKLDNVIFAGRLADYQYYNMDQVAARALSVFEKEILK